MVIMTVLMWVGVASCSKDDDATDSFSIVGTWEGDFGGYTETYTFNSDGSYYDITSKGHRYEGVYTYSNGTLTKKEKTDDGYSTFTCKVEVVSPKKMVWSNFSDAPNERVTFNKL